MFIECNENCPYQENGCCNKLICTAENGRFESFNLCPYASISIMDKQEKNIVQKKKSSVLTELYL